MYKSWLRAMSDKTHGKEGKKWRARTLSTKRRQKRGDCEG